MCRYLNHLNKKVATDADEVNDDEDNDDAQQAMTMLRNGPAAATNKTPTPAANPPTKQHIKAATPAIKQQHIKTPMAAAAAAVTKHNKTPDAAKRKTKKQTTPAVAVTNNNQPPIFGADGVTFPIWQNFGGSSSFGVFWVNHGLSMDKQQPILRFLQVNIGMHLRWYELESLLSSLYNPFSDRTRESLLPPSCALSSTTRKLPGF